MCSVQVKEARHPILYPYHTPSMMKPAISPICGKGKGAGDASDVKSRLEWGADAGPCKNCVGRLQRDIILWALPAWRPSDTCLEVSFIV
jgi:hypothetical protein